MSSKTKTFEAVEVRTTKKYRITIHEFEGKKGEV